MIDVLDNGMDRQSVSNPHPDASPTPAPVEQNQKNAKYVPMAEDNFDVSKALVKLIAFYLPQFHQIPENDEWWGKGFTEWTNVRKAEPNFEGHYQPRAPIDLGYYDLLDTQVQKRQIELAKKYGVYGFCFYYYWFAGKRLLERPLNQFLTNTELDFPFCICWANENWTRRWDGREDDILIGQIHSEEEYAAFIRDVASILQDKRYIRIDGKPVLAVYRVSILPHPEKAAEIWREECHKLGVGEIFLAAIQSFGIEDPRPYGFDAAVEFPPQICLPAAVEPSSLPIINEKFAGTVWDYGVMAKLKMLEPLPDYLKFRTVMPSWDNTPRRQNNSNIFIHASPVAYKNWLKQAAEYTREYLPEDKQFVFINAWNEWGESAYLEPDELYGYAYLQATNEAIQKSPLREQIVQTPAEQMEEMDRIIQALFSFWTRKEQISQIQLNEKERVIQVLTTQLNEIMNTNTWKYGEFLYKIRLKLLPDGSTRLKIVQSLQKFYRKYRGTT